MELCEYVSILCKHLAKEGLSWNYHCVAETGRYDDFLIGEGEFITYYAGFDYHQSEHARFSFCRDEDKTGLPTGEVHFLAMYGVQGPGEHNTLETIKSPTEQQIEEYVKIVANWLKEKRIPVDD